MNGLHFNGQRKIVVEITYNNNKEINRKTISDTVVTEPINEVILVGTKEKEMTPEYKSVQVMTEINHVMIEFITQILILLI